MRRSPRSFLIGAAVALVAVAALGVDTASAQGSARQGGAGQYEARLPIPAPPSPPRLVNDLAGIFSATERDALERKLVAVDDSTGAQIAVVTVRTIEGAEPIEYAVALGRAWGVGGGGFNNGVVLLVAVDDREVTIATGYGAEGALTDAITGSIIRETVVPRFREEQYFAGVDAATDDIIAALAGEFSRPQRPPGGSPGIGNLLCCLFMLFVVMLVFASRQKGGPTGGPTSRRRGRSRGPGIIILPGFGGGFGGGGFGGGGFGGGGGGGFGGFGGGSFGGGGASGSW